MTEYKICFKGIEFFKFNLPNEINNHSLILDEIKNIIKPYMGQKATFETHEKMQKEIDDYLKNIIGSN